MRDSRTKPSKKKTEQSLQKLTETEAESTGPALSVPRPLCICYSVQFSKRECATE